MTEKVPNLPASVRSRGWVGLAEIILEGTRGGWPDAACVGRHELFDEARADRLNGGVHPHPHSVVEAARVCDGCVFASSCSWRASTVALDPPRRRGAA